MSNIRYHKLCVTLYLDLVANRHVCASRRDFLDFLPVIDWVLDRSISVSEFHILIEEWISTKEAMGSWGRANDNWIDGFEMARCFSSHGLSESDLNAILALLNKGQTERTLAHVPESWIHAAEQLWTVVDPSRVGYITSHEYQFLAAASMGEHVLRMRPRDLEVSATEEITRCGAHNGQLSLMQWKLHLSSSGVTEDQLCDLRTAVKSMLSATAAALPPFAIRANNGAVRLWDLAVYREIDRRMEVPALVAGGYLSDLRRFLPVNAIPLLHTARRKDMDMWKISAMLHKAFAVEFSYRLASFDRTSLDRDPLFACILSVLECYKGAINSFTRAAADAWREHNGWHAPVKQPVSGQFPSVIALPSRAQARNPAPPTYRPAGAWYSEEAVQYSRARPGTVGINFSPPVAAPHRPGTYRPGELTAAPLPGTDNYPVADLSAFRVGDRCKVGGSRAGTKGSEGVIRYVGTAHFQPHPWIGVELDEEAGLNDGSIKGVRYFSCSKPGNYGMFVRPHLVIVPGNSEGGTSAAAPAGTSVGDGGDHTAGGNDDGDGDDDGGGGGHTPRASSSSQGVTSTLPPAPQSGATATVIDSKVAGHQDRYYAKLVRAVEKNDMDRVRELVSRGVDVNFRGEADGWTVLHVAAYMGRAEAVLFFMQSGADYTLRENKGKSARDLASERGHAACVALIEAEANRRLAGENSGAAAAAPPPKKKRGWRLLFKKKEKASESQQPPQSPALPQLEGVARASQQGDSPLAKHDAGAVQGQDNGEGTQDAASPHTPEGGDRGSAAERASATLQETASELVDTSQRASDLEGGSAPVVSAGGSDDRQAHRVPLEEVDLRSITEVTPEDELREVLKVTTVPGSVPIDLESVDDITPYYLKTVLRSMGNNNERWPREPAEVSDEYFASVYDGARYSHTSVSLANRTAATNTTGGGGRGHASSHSSRPSRDADLDLSPVAYGPRTPGGATPHGQGSQPLYPSYSGFQGVAMPTASYPLPCSPPRASGGSSLTPYVAGVVLPKPPPVVEKPPNGIVEPMPISGVPHRSQHRAQRAM